ncbi:piggybac transposable element-derived protein 4-like isoform x2 protein, partial [Lasius niger]
MTEKRFLTYYKSLNTKLNHIINLLKDRHTDMQVDEEDSLLPNFHLRTVQEFEQFQENLVTSLELQKLYIREIKMIGGSDPDKFTRAALGYFISNEVALKYSWSGQKNTRKFRETLISQLIV